MGRRERKMNYPAAVVFDPYCVLFLVYEERAANGGGNSRGKHMP